MPSSVVLRPIYQEPVSPSPFLRGAVLSYLFEGTATKSLGSLEPTGHDTSTSSSVLLAYIRPQAATQVLQNVYKAVRFLRFYRCLS